MIPCARSLSSRGRYHFARRDAASAGPHQPARLLRRRQGLDRWQRPRPSRGRQRRRRRCHGPPARAVGACDGAGDAARHCECGRDRGGAQGHASRRRRRRRTVLRVGCTKGTKAALAPRADAHAESSGQWKPSARRERRKRLPTCECWPAATPHCRDRDREYHVAACRTAECDAVRRWYGGHRAAVECGTAGRRKWRQRQWRREPDFGRRRSRRD